MNKIKKQLSLDLSSVVGFSVEENNFSAPPNSEAGDLALPCFDFAKSQKKNPVELAKEIKEKLNDTLDYLEKVETQGPYLNFTFKTDYLFNEVLGAKNKKGIRISVPIRNPLYKPLKIMIEYSQPNTHKEFHVGHLRNACLGASLVNVNRYLGHKVISANYLGDTGVHVAKTLWNFQKFHKDDQLPENKGQFLGKIYSEAVNKLDDNKEFQTEVSELQKKLEEGDKELTKLWKETKQWSLDSFDQIYKLLGIEFDQWFWESEEEEAGRKMIDKILKKGTIKEIKESQGAIIADLTAYDLDVLVLVKSDGNMLYGTKDLPLGKKKFDKFKIDKSVYIIDNRQSLYVKQIFKLLDLLGYDKKDKYHVAYDFVTLPEGAMASRTGNVVTFEDFYNEVLELSKTETALRHTDWTVDKVNETAEHISLAAIKFWMLKYDNNKVIVFDPKKALAFDGDTGPYILYTIARINSIFAKSLTRDSAISGDEDFNLLTDQSERELALQIAKFEDTITKVAENYSPITLCTYLIELSHNFNNFYHKCHVLDQKEDLQKARLALLHKTRETLEKGLDLLNIKSVLQM